MRHDVGQHGARYGLALDGVEVASVQRPQDGGNRELVLAMQTSAWMPSYEAQATASTVRATLPTETGGG